MMYVLFKWIITVYIILFNFVESNINNQTLNALKKDIFDDNLFDQKSNSPSLTIDDVKWNEQLKRRQQQLYSAYTEFQNLSPEIQEKKFYKKTPDSVKYVWFYEYYGKLSGFILAFSIVLIYHIIAFTYGLIVYYRRKRKYIENAGSLLKPKSIKRKNPYYEELQLIPSRDISQMLSSLATEQTSFTQETERVEDYQNLIKDTAFTPQKPYPPIYINTSVPFSEIGIKGPHGERIIEKSVKIREPLPGEKKPIIYDIDNIPKEILGNSGFYEFEKLTSKEVVIIKTDRTSDGYLRGYFGGRIPEK